MKVDELTSLAFGGGMQILVAEYCSCIPGSNIG